MACQAPMSMEFSRQPTGVDWHALLQGIFPTQWLNPRLLKLLLWQVGSLQLVPHGKPPTSKILYNLALAYLSDLISSHSLHFTHTVLISVSLRGKDPSHHRGLWSSYSSVMDATFQNFCTTDSLLKSTLSEILFFIMLAKVLPFPCLSYFILYVTYQHQKI